MDIKNYEKGHEYTRFDFRRLLVEEFQDSELGWWIYGSSRFIEGRRMARILEIISGILDGGEGVGKVWVGFGVALVFLENFLEREKAHFNILRRLRCAPGLFCAMDWSVDPLVHHSVNSTLLGAVHVSQA